MKKFLTYCIDLFFRFILIFRYRIKYKGLENLNAESLNKPGGILFLPNHPSVFIDPAIVTMAVWKKFPIRPMVIDYMYHKPLVHQAVTLLDALPIPNFSEGSNSLKRKKGEEVMQTVINDLRDGDNFLIYPGGGLKQSSLEEIGANSAAHRIVQEVPEANVVLVRIKGLWGSMFSRALTGRTPPMLTCVLRGIKIVLKNLIFFTPKREITVEFYPAPTDFPYQANRLDFNRYLEHWYNRPDGLSDQKLGDSLMLISYSRWREELPELYSPESTQEENIHLDEIPEEIKELVNSELALLAKMDPKQIKPEMQLSTDLGLDSLDTAEFLAYLHDHYELNGIPMHELTSVGKVWAIAAKQITFENEAVEETTLDFAKWNAPRPQRRCVIADGDTIPEVFLRNCKLLGKQMACGDIRSGFLTYSDVCVRTLLMASYIRNLPGKYVGVLLPASVPAYLCVLACQMAGKIPLLVNWTIGPRHLESIIALSNVEVILSSWTFVDRLENVDLTGIENRLVMLEDVRNQFTLTDKLKSAWMSKRSVKSILKSFGIDKQSKDDPAVLLFTSGTESMPKGVPLSHENILSNQRDALNTVDIFSNDCMFAFLPPFHSFGLCYGGLLGFLSGIKIAFSPDPTNGKQLADNFERWGANLFCSAPTFVKNMLKFAKVDQLKKLRMCITGAEKTPPELFSLMESFGKSDCLTEGYGITECSPVLTLNHPDDPIVGVGKPLPSVEIRVVHQETYEPLPIGDRGMIIAKGPNIFSGYLNKGLKSPFVEIDGEKWYITGDLGYLDDEKHLTISGRKKRFVKIGGEMVSLAAIEHAVLDEYSKTEMRRS